MAHPVLTTVLTTNSTGHLRTLFHTRELVTVLAATCCPWPMCFLKHDALIPLRLPSHPQGLSSVFALTPVSTLLLPQDDLCSPGGGWRVTGLT